MASPPWFRRSPRTLALITLAAAISVLLAAVVWPSQAPAAPTESAQPTASATTDPATVSDAASGVESDQAQPTTKVKKPRAATKTRKAKHIPERPRDRHTGKRIVYDKQLMTVWLMDKNDEVVARYPVVGRWDRPEKGTYRVFSKSPASYNPESDVTFTHMVRFAPGLQTGYSIGFHAIPRYRDGSMMHSEKQLGLPIARGGCVRLSDKAAKHVYRFLDKGDLVVVLPSP